MLCCAGSLSNCAFPPAQPLDHSWPLSIHAYHVLLWSVVLHCWRRHHPALHHHSPADHLGRNLPYCDILVGSFGIDRVLRCAVPGAELQQEGELAAAPAVLPRPACCAFKLLHAVLCNRLPAVPSNCYILCRHDLPAVLSSCHMLCSATDCLLCLMELPAVLLPSCTGPCCPVAKLVCSLSQLASSCQAACDKYLFIRLLT